MVYYPRTKQWSQGRLPVSRPTSSSDELGCDVRGRVPVYTSGSTSLTAPTTVGLPIATSPLSHPNAQGEGGTRY